MPAPAEPRAPGFLVALCVIAGAVIGGLYRQPSIGFLAGLAAGAAVALIAWLRSR